jgi:phycocyanobilin lyase subunit beta
MVNESPNLSSQFLAAQPTELTTERTIEQLIKAVELASNPPELIRSVQVLADQRSLAATPTLIKALGFNNPGAAIAAMYGLIAIGRAAVPELLALIDNYNYGARAYTVRALAKIGDPRAFEILLHCAVQDFAPSVRRAAIKGLGYLQWSSLEVKDVDICQSQTRILATLSSILRDTDWSMRYASIVALDRLTEKCADLAIAHLQEALSLETNLGKDQSVIARIKLALTKIPAKT